MGLNWRTLGWREYQMNLAGWNEHHRDPGESPTGPGDLGRLRRFVEAHTVH